MKTDCSAMTSVSTISNVNPATALVLPGSGSLQRNDRRDCFSSPILSHIQVELAL